MSHVVLIRPGATAYDEEGRIQGVLDLPLSDRGVVEVAALVERLAGVELAALYCGPGDSVGHTAEIVGRALGLRPKRLDDLRNLDHGLWQGLLRDEVRRRNARLYRRWIDEPGTICPPRGESVAEAAGRVACVLKPLLKRHRGETIGLVAPDPIASVIARHLRRAPGASIPEDVPPGGFEWVAVAPSTPGLDEAASPSGLS